MSELNSLKPFPTKLRLSHQIFLLGIAVRVWLTLSLNTSYLHPEESDSQRQLEGDVFGFWSSHDRVRSTLWPLLTNGLPSFLLRLCFGPEVARKPELLLCSIRLVMLGLSFLTDVCVYRTCQRLGLDSFAALATLASSCAMVVFHTRPLQGAVDMCLVALLLYSLADVIVLSNQLKHASIQYFQRRQRLQRQRANKALRNKPEADGLSKPDSNRDPALTTQQQNSSGGVSAQQRRTSSASVESTQQAHNQPSAPVLPPSKLKASTAPSSSKPTVCTSNPRAIPKHPSSQQRKLPSDKSGVPIKRKRPLVSAGGRLLGTVRLLPFPNTALWGKLLIAATRLVITWELLLFNNVLAALLTIPALVAAHRAIGRLQEHYASCPGKLQRLRRYIVALFVLVFVLFVIFDTCLTNGKELRERHGGLNFLLYLTLLLGSYAWRLLDVSIRGLLDNSKEQLHYMLQMVFPIGSRRRPVSAANLAAFLVPVCQSWVVAIMAMTLSGHDVAVWDLSCLVVPACIVFGYRTFGREASFFNSSIWVGLNVAMIAYFGCIHQSGVTPSLGFVHRQLSFYNNHVDMRASAVYVGVPSARSYLPSIPDQACPDIKIYDLAPNLPHASVLEFLRNVTQPAVVPCRFHTPTALVLFTVAEARLGLRPSDLPGKSTVAKVIWPHFNPAAPPRLAHITSFWEWSLVIYKSIVPVTRLQSQHCLVPDGGCLVPA
eukprot:m.136644 g.136644  ORF g.136644 m.136644 type:complete len:715 (-) comp16030_c0_seq1:115-2259(-)